MYYNVLLLNENPDFQTAIQTYIDDGLEYGVDYSITVEVDYDNLSMNVVVTDSLGAEAFNENITILPTSTTEEEASSISNETIYNLIREYAMEEIPVDNGEGVEGEPSEEVETVPNDLSTYNLVVKSLAENVTADFYIDNLESFLWIKNIYKAESPTTSPVFTKSEITNYLERYYSPDEQQAEEDNDYEGQIFDYVVAGLEERNLDGNGYFILVILAVLTSFLSIFLNNFLSKKTTGTQPGGKMMYFIMPLILGIFTLMYTSLFAIYIIVGQIMMIALSPLTNLIVKKWIEASDKKKEKKKKETIDVDYRRKDI